VPEIMLPEMLVPERRHDLIPVRRVAEHSGTDPAAPGSGEQTGIRVRPLLYLPADHGPNLLNETRTTLVLLVSGRFKVDLSTEEALLPHQGDYLVWGPASTTGGTPRPTRWLSPCGGRPSLLKRAWSAGDIRSSLGPE
jgi:hypothetical protein